MPYVVLSSEKDHLTEVKEKLIQHYIANYIDC